MNVVEKNPYRYLGVYSNSPTKERVANQGKMNAFLKVGKPVSFPLDLPNLLSPIERTEENVADAVSKLTLPADQLKYAQFWWMKVTDIDSIAFNHLLSGNIDVAKSVWEKKDDASSLQNRIVLALIQQDYATAISCAENLYNNHASSFVTAIADSGTAIDGTALAHSFLDALIDDGLDIQTLLSHITDAEWKAYVAEKSITPLIDSITQAIATAQASRGKGPVARYRAGQKLMTSTKSALSKLKSHIPTTDIRYTTIADKLGIEILQCGIDYFNDSDDEDNAEKAMVLQSYALSIVEGSMAKQRCQENNDILQNIIEHLPPLEIRAEDNAIKKELKNFQENNYNPKGCKNLLFNCEQHLVSIKSKLENQNEYYIKISTLIANVLLGYIIERCNEVVNDNLETKIKEDSRGAYFSLMWTLRFSWNIILNIEILDTSADFQKKRLAPNKKTILKIISQLDYIFYVHNSDIDLDEYFAGIRRNPSCMDFGDGVEHFIYEYLNCFENGNKLLVFGWSNAKYSLGSSSFLPYGTKVNPPTNGFMTDYEKERFIDIRTERDFYLKCLEDFNKRPASKDGPSMFVYNDYLEKFPKGKYVEEVKKFKSKINSEYALFRKHRSSISDCEEYMQKYPDGWYINQIKKEIDHHTFEHYKSIGHVSRYLKEYPHGEYVFEAKKIIKHRNRVILFWILCVFTLSAIITTYIYFEWSSIGAIIAGIIASLIAINAIYFNVLGDKYD